MNKATARIIEARRKAKDRMERLRLDVLTVIKELEACKDGEGNRVEASHQRHIIDALKKRGWSGHDFKGKWGSDDFERAVDAALQYHRRRGAIEFWPGHGWETKPVKDEGLQG